MISQLGALVKCKSPPNLHPSRAGVVGIDIDRCIKVTVQCINCDSHTVSSVSTHDSKFLYPKQDTML